MDNAPPSKDATAATIEANQRVYQQLPFSNTADFDDAHKGFIASVPDVIKDKDGNIIWDSRQYQFIQEGSKSPPTVNPSLWRQSQLLIISGLFQILPGAYQIRGLDLSNMTILEGNDGIIIVDPLLSAETAKAGLDVYFKHRGEKSIIAVIFTHSHADHFGGTRGVVDEEDVKSGKVKIYAPSGFLEASIDENVFAGTAMSRRASYMYGNVLKPDPKQTVGAGLGPTTSQGTLTLLQPTHYITQTGQEEVIDGLHFEFLMAPGSEAPSEMLWYIKEMKLIESSEICSHTLHNTYSLRGAKIRDPLAWSKYLNVVLDRWGSEAEVLIAQHFWPTWGKDNITALLTAQRDIYRFINDETLRLANHGYTRDEIAAQVKLPDTLAQTWANRGYYGSVSHNVKGTYVYYLGWFDGNPATLDELPPDEAAKKFVEYMGGAEAVLNKAKIDFENGNYRWVAQVVNKVIFADPTNTVARDLQADTLEQLGYQAESATWRNFYLSGCHELRSGVVKTRAPNTVSPDIITAMTPEMFFDYMAVRLNAEKAANAKALININLDGHKYKLELGSGVLNHTPNAHASDADAAITLSRSAFNSLFLKQNPVEEIITNGEMTISGDVAKVQELIGYIDKFDFWFNIVEP